MPRLVSALPRYRKHRKSGQAIVTLSGRDYYLGPHGTKASHHEYDRLIAEWLAAVRRPLRDQDGTTGAPTVVELFAAYRTHAERYYRKNGRITNEVTAILSAANIASSLYGRELTEDFGPLKLEAIQQAMIRANWTRKHINKQTGRIVRMFSWGVTKEMVSAEVVNKLREVPGLHKGRSDARESAPVMPVDDSVVNATLEHLPQIVADMVRLQRLTGCRPEEVCMVRPCDVDRSGDIWTYCPESHKTEHHDKRRIICIGPKGKKILRPYLLRNATDYCFSPEESERRRRDSMHASRKTPLSCGNRPGTNRKPKRARPAGHKYTTESYRRAIYRACELAFDMPTALRKKVPNETPAQRATRLQLARQWREKHCWASNQLRHSAATEIRKRFGLEAAQVTLGHAAADVTQIYAERDLEKAIQVMKLIG